ncbi:13570_t:CDS:2 [Ambispora gerdemannii]|uniref:13570_t:CDS:1 n=1 Tax=Ambispora gerdemannii TaxID=144530 RepID=A0A9N9GG80_9GLOM|nr:13570_t:CDS:2 [Ambispora gerdemannii]
MTTNLETYDDWETSTKTCPRAENTSYKFTKIENLLQELVSPKSNWKKSYLSTKNTSTKLSTTLSQSDSSSKKLQSAIKKENTRINNIQRKK